MSRMVLKTLCSSFGALSVICSYCGATLGLASSFFLEFRLEVVGLREKIGRIQWNPSHLLHELCYMKGTGFFFVIILSLPLFARYKLIPFISLPTSRHPHLLDSMNVSPCVFEPREG